MSWIQKLYPRMYKAVTDAGMDKTIQLQSPAARSIFNKVLKDLDLCLITPWDSIEGTFKRIEEELEIREMLGEDAVAELKKDGYLDESQSAE